MSGTGVHGDHAFGALEKRQERADRQIVGNVMQIGHAGQTNDLGVQRVFRAGARDRKSTRLNSSHGYISYAVFCLKKKKMHVRRPKFRREHAASANVNMFGAGALRMILNDASVLSPLLVRIRYTAPRGLASPRTSR